MNTNKFQIHSLPKYATDSEALYDERESGSTHLDFQVELALCQGIQTGNVDAVEKLLDETLHKEFLMGFFTENPEKQAKYWSIAVIATAIHYAILGGLDETDAYNLSDHYIQRIDACKTLDEMVEYLTTQAIELTSHVASAQNTPSVSAPIKSACHYIHVHLHEPLDVGTVAKEAGLSYSYFSTRFRKELGQSVHHYILKEKLGAAEQLLLQGKSVKEICYTLSFSSQSHFIQLFKKQYNMTPGEYARHTARYEKTVSF